MYDILIQLIAVVGLVLLISSFFYKKMNSIILLQSVAVSFFLVHYALLGALSGAVTSFIMIVRHILMYKLECDKLLSYIFIGVFLVTGLLFCQSVMSFLPFIGAMIYTSQMPYTKKRLIYGSFLNIGCWLTYNTFVGSYAGMITASCLCIGNIMALLKMNEKKKAK